MRANRKYHRLSTTTNTNWKLQLSTKNCKSKTRNVRPYQRACACVCACEFHAGVLLSFTTLKYSSVCACDSKTKYTMVGDTQRYRSDVCGRQPIASFGVLNTNRKQTRIKKYNQTHYYIGYIIFSHPRNQTETKQITHTI